MNIEHENFRTLDDEELEQISGGRLEAFGYHLDANILNYGYGDILHVSWGRIGGVYNYYEIAWC
ncbi:ComC/BlpC family leader-containing pheromone/bacteriocin [Pseudomonas sp. SH1-B]